MVFRIDASSPFVQFAVLFNLMSILSLMNDVGLKNYFANITLHWSSYNSVRDVSSLIVCGDVMHHRQIHATL